MAEKKSEISSSVQNPTKNDGGGSAGSGSEKENGLNPSSRSWGEQTPSKKKKRKILDSDNDDDEDYSPTKKSSKTTSTSKRSTTEKAEKKAASATEAQPHTTSKHKEHHNKAKEKSSSKEGHHKHHHHHHTSSSTSTSSSVSNSSPNKMAAATPTVRQSSNELSNGNPETDKQKPENQQKERERSKLFPKSVTMPTKVVQALPLEVSKPDVTTTVPQATITSSPAKPKSQLAKKIEVSTPKGGSFDVLGSIMKDMTK